MLNNLDAPNKYNPCYYSDANIFVRAGYGMPNCTAFCWGRIYERTGKKYNKICGNPNKWIAQAQKSGLSTGTVPRANSVIVWNRHVAFVEQISENGDLLTTNSQWKGKEFFTKVITKSSGYEYAKGFKLLGFIYLP